MDNAPLQRGDIGPHKLKLVRNKYKIKKSSFVQFFNSLPKNISYDGHDCEFLKKYSSTLI